MECFLTSCIYCKQLFESIFDFNEIKIIKTFKSTLDTFLASSCFYDIIMNI